MLRFLSLLAVAAAVVIAFHSGSVFLVLATLCGACGIAALSNTPAAQPTAVKVTVRGHGSRQGALFNPTGDNRR